MNGTLDRSRSLASAVAGGVDAALADRCEVVLFPPFPYLQAVGEILADSPIALGAQDVCHKPDGAYTGEVSTSMLIDLGVTHVLVGHSERRHVIGERDELVNAKLRASLDAGLTTVLCIGETLEQRVSGETEAVNLAQFRAGLDGVSKAQMSRVVIAYEPVWAIGTGRTATPDDAESVHRMIRQEAEARYDDSFASSLRIQYGGSVKGGNASALFACADIDGGLIGGASLDAAEFLTIVRSAADYS